MKPVIYVPNLAGPDGRLLYDFDEDWRTAAWEVYQHAERPERVWADRSDGQLERLLGVQPTVVPLADLEPDGPGLYLVTTIPWGDGVIGLPTDGQTPFATIPQDPPPGFQPPTVDAERLALIQRKDDPGYWAMAGGGAYTPDADFAETAAARFQLKGGVCRKCDRPTWDPTRCPDCGGEDFQEAHFPREGSVLTYTRIRPGTGPAEFDPASAALGWNTAGIVVMSMGPLMTAQIRDPDQEVTIGASVLYRVRRLYVQDGQVRYGGRFSFLSPPSPDPVAVASG